MDKSIKPPAVPLVTVDPYFSIWSMADKLFYDNTRHWTGAEHGMTGMVQIDGKVYRFMGQVGSVTPMEQVSLQVKPLSTIYVFTAACVEITLKFTTPLLLDDLDVLSRPASYIAAEVRSLDGKGHSVKLYLDVTGELSVNTKDQEVVWGRKMLRDGSEALHIGTKEQCVLNKCGDDLRIDWGYAYLAVPAGTIAQTYIGSFKVRESFMLGKGFPVNDDTEMPRPVAADMPVMAAVLDYGTVTDQKTVRYLVLAYDDTYSVEYFCKPLKGYWARNGMTFEQMLEASIRDYDLLMEKCNAFDRKLSEEAEKNGGKKYADILALAYRQSIAAHKLVEDERGNVLFFSKECFSNGCMGTVDVSYPSIPLFLLYNPELVKGMLRPVFEFARMPVWQYDFAPHDVGRYPHANGQVYALKGRAPLRTLITPPLSTMPPEQEAYRMDRQMPVEECGNMLIMTAAVCMVNNDVAFAQENWDLLSKWVEYLKVYGLDPGNQLCTDDFAGHLAHNVNLSVKAIVGIASYALLCNMLGKEGEAEKHRMLAKEMAAEWEKNADDGDHYRLAFDAPGTWSMKYNLVWDILFGTEVFSPAVARKEIEYYKKVKNKYGLPLDSRCEYTKSDWLLWCAAMTENSADFDVLVEPLWDFLNETPCRVPFTDWYETVSAYQTHCRCHTGKGGFRNRTVQGGLFIKLLADTKRFAGSR